MLQDLAAQWIQRYPCETYSTRNDEKPTNNSRSWIESKRLLTLTIHWTMEKACADLQWNHRPFLTHRPRDTWKCAESSTKSKRALRLWCCSPDSMNSGGQNLWNVIATSAMCKICYQMGKLHMKGNSKNNSHSEQNSSIILSSAERSGEAPSVRQDSLLGQINGSRSHCGRGAGKETRSQQTLRNYRRPTHPKCIEEEKRSSCALLYHFVEGSAKLAGNGSEIHPTEFVKISKGEQILVHVRRKLNVLQESSYLITLM